MTTTTEKVYVVQEFIDRLHDAILSGMAGTYWIEGEVEGLSKSGDKKNWFFNLVSTDQTDGKRYSLPCVVWPKDQKKLLSHGELPADGTVVRFQGHVAAFKARGATPQFIVHDIDTTEARVGEVESTKISLADTLKADGTLERQKRLMPFDLQPPFRIALVTSVDSAAYHDFTKEIQSGGYEFRVSTFDARTQGDQAVPSVVAALAAAAQSKPSFIALVRGGGSRHDLSWFDREEIVRAVADSPIPVLTGIGHEIDTSIADLAAWRSFKTPTAVAAWLVELAKVHESDLVSWHARLKQLVSASWGGAVQWLTTVMKQFDVEQRALLEREEAELAAGLEKLHLLEPERVLERGFAIVRHYGDNRVVKNGNVLDPEDIIKIQFKEDVTVVATIDVS